MGGGKERKKRGRTKECNNRKGVYVFQMSKRPRQRASASNYPWILVKMEDRCFYVGASSALSLRALKKHLTPFKTLSRLSSAPLNSGGPELSKIRRKPFPLLPILDTFLPFFFLTTGTTYYKGERERIKIDFITGERGPGFRLVVWVRERGILR